MGDEGSEESEENYRTTVIIDRKAKASVIGKYGKIFYTTYQANKGKGQATRKKAQQCRRLANKKNSKNEKRIEQ